MSDNNNDIELPTPHAPGFWPETPAPDSYRQDEGPLEAAGRSLPHNADSEAHELKDEDIPVSKAASLAPVILATGAGLVLGGPIGGIVAGMTAGATTVENEGLKKHMGHSDTPYHQLTEDDQQDNSTSTPHVHSDHNNDSSLVVPSTSAFDDNASTASTIGATGAEPEQVTEEKTQAALAASPAQQMLGQDAHSDLSALMAGGAAVGVAAGAGAGLANQGSTQAQELEEPKTDLTQDDRDPAISGVVPDEAITSPSASTVERSINPDHETELRQEEPTATKVKEPEEKEQSRFSDKEKVALGAGAAGLGAGGLAAAALGRDQHEQTIANSDYAAPQANTTDGVLSPEASRFTEGSSLFPESGRQEHDQHCTLPTTSHEQTPQEPVATTSETLPTTHEVVYLAPIVVDKIPASSTDVTNSTSAEDGRDDKEGLSEGEGVVLGAATGAGAGGLAAAAVGRDQHEDTIADSREVPAAHQHRSLLASDNNDLTSIDRQVGSSTIPTVTDDQKSSAIPREVETVDSSDAPDAANIAEEKDHTNRNLALGAGGAALGGAGLASTYESLQDNKSEISPPDHKATAYPAQRDGEAIESTVPQPVANPSDPPAGTCFVPEVTEEQRQAAVPGEVETVGGAERASETSDVEAREAEQQREMDKEDHTARNAALGAGAAAVGGAGAYGAYEALKSNHDNQSGSIGASPLGQQSTTAEYLENKPREEIEATMPTTVAPPSESLHQGTPISSTRATAEGSEFKGPSSLAQEPQNQQRSEEDHTGRNVALGAGGLALGGAAAYGAHEALQGPEQHRDGSGQFLPLQDTFDGQRATAQDPYITGQTAEHSTHNVIDPASLATPAAATVPGFVAGDSIAKQDFAHLSQQPQQDETLAREAQQEREREGLSTGEKVGAGVLGGAGVGLGAAALASHDRQQEQLLQQQHPGITTNASLQRVLNESQPNESPSKPSSTRAMKGSPTATPGPEDRLNEPSYAPVAAGAGMAGVGAGAAGIYAAEENNLVHNNDNNNLHDPNNEFTNHNNHEEPSLASSQREAEQREFEQGATMNERSSADAQREFLEKHGVHKSPHMHIATHEDDSGHTKLHKKALGDINVVERPQEVPIPIERSPHMKIATTKDSLGHKKLHKKSLVAGTPEHQGHGHGRHSSIDHDTNGSPGFASSGHGQTTHSRGNSQELSPGEQTWNNSVAQVVHDETAHRHGHAPGLVQANPNDRRDHVMDRMVGIQDPSSPTRSSSEQHRNKLTRPRRASRGDASEASGSMNSPKKEGGFFSKMFGSKKKE